MFPAHRSFADPYEKIMVFRENPAKCPSLAKNPPKYTTAYIVQQSISRWHCEPTFFFGLCAAKALFSCPAIISQRLEPRITSNGPLENTEKESKII